MLAGSSIGGLEGGLGQSERSGAGSCSSGDPSGVQGRFWVPPPLLRPPAGSQWEDAESPASAASQPPASEGPPPAPGHNPGGFGQLWGTEQDGERVPGVRRPLPLLLGASTQALDKLPADQSLAEEDDNSEAEELLLVGQELVGRQPSTSGSALVPGIGELSGEELREVRALMQRGGGSDAEPPELGSWLLPTVGSAGHRLRICKPCAFVNTKGCKDGVQCRFCHLCEPGEKKRRKKEKNAFLRTVRRWQRPGEAAAPSEAPVWH